MGDIGKLLDASITGVDMLAKPAPVMDLSKIDFEALRSRFKESQHKNTDLELFKAAIRAQLEMLIRPKKARIDFQEKFEELIESYNAGSRNIEGRWVATFAGGGWGWCVGGWGQAFGGG